MAGAGANTINRKQLADEIDAIDAEIKLLNGSKSDTYRSYREQLEAEGMSGERASAEIAATKAAIARRRKLRENPEAVLERDALIDEILAEIGTRVATRAREADEPAIAADSGEDIPSVQPMIASSPDTKSTAARKDVHPSPSADSSADSRVTLDAEEPTNADMHPQWQARPEEGAGTQAPPVDTTPLNDAAANALKLRPHCLSPNDLSKCAGQGRRHCYACQKAFADRDGIAA